MRTVFVIGAGANVEIGMPSGNELRMIIAELLKSNKRDPEGVYDELIDRAIEKYTNASLGSDDEREANLICYRTAAINISKAMPPFISIDNFIEARMDDWPIEFCGKLAIVRAILDAEYNSTLSLAFNESLSESKKAEEINTLYSSWYQSAFNKMREGCTSIEALSTRFADISFIIFNYDRCFEYFMYQTLIISYDASKERAREFVEQLNIIHPYGTVGSLWDDKGDLTFEKRPTEIKLMQLAHETKTFTESREQEKNAKNSVQYLVDRADRIIFLGFAYHIQNLDVLFKHSSKLFIKDNAELRDNLICYGTGHETKENEIKYICSILKSKDSRIGDIYISPITCADFFKEFWYRLSFKS